jgi:putative aminopeptidase FrvX
MDKKFLEEYLNGYTPTGYEHLEDSNILVNYLRKYTDKVYDDNYGNIIGVINPEAEYKVVLDAHQDEICFIVSHIDKDGHLFVKKNGGADPQIAPAKTCYVFTSEGKRIQGLFGHIAVHLRHDDKKDYKPELEKLWIDVGADSDKEVEKMGIKIGDIAIFDDKFKILNNNKICARSLDDKIGIFINTQIIKMLYDNKDKLLFGLYIVCSVQEEIGLRGAEMATQSIKPNIAICIDPCHNSNIPHISTKNEGDFKFDDGVVFTQAPGIHRLLNKLMMNIATENNIKYKLNIKPTYTGTNSDSYTYSNGGVVTGLVSIPLKYMHCLEMVSMNDVQSAIDLIYNVVKKIENNQDFRYLKL